MSDQGQGAKDPHFLTERPRARVRKHGVAEQFIVGGDDILDGRAVLGFLQAQRIDQNALVRDGCHHTLEFGQLTTGGRQLLQDDRRFEALSGEPVERENGRPIDLVARILRMVKRIALCMSLHMCIATALFRCRSAHTGAEPGAVGMRKSSSMSRAVSGRWWSG